MAYGRAAGMRGSSSSQQIIKRSWIQLCFAQDEWIFIFTWAIAPLLDLESLQPHILESKNIFVNIENLLESMTVIPAEVAQQLMKSDDPEAEAIIESLIKTFFT